MSLPQLRRSLLDLRGTLLAYGLGFAVYALVIVAFWPTMKENSALYRELMKSLPEGMAKAFGVGGDFGTYTGFLGTEYLNIIWPIIAAVFLIMSASALVAGEIDRGTVELWLSVPAPRWRLLAAKELALAAGALVLVVVTVASLVAGGAVVGASLTASGVVGLGVVLLAFCVAVAGYTTLLSALAASRGSAAGIAAGITFASYLAGVLAGISNKVEALKYVSFTTAFRPQDALEGRDYVTGALVLIAVGVVCALVALVAFERRDANP